MDRTQKLTLAGLVTVSGVALAGLILTSGVAWWDKPAQDTRFTAAGRALAADEQVLETAQKVVALAATSKEQEFARSALRLADQDVDLAFTDALRNAAEQPAPPNGAARALQAQIARTNAEIKTLKDKVAGLTAEQAHAKGPRLAEIQEQLELAQAELALDQDSLADAQEDLVRTGGDAYGEIQRLWQQHEAEQHAKETAQAAPSASSAAVAASGSSVIARWRDWRALRRAHVQIVQGREEALRVTNLLAQQHAALEQKPAAKPAPLPGPAPGTNASSAPASFTTDAAASLAALHRLSVHEKNLADLDKRIMDLRELTGIYDQWSSVAKGRERAALHSLILAALYILLTILVVWLAGRVTERAFSRVSLERRQLVTLRGVVQFSLNALGIAVVLLVLFGLPSNLSTILGLAGAGLTVVLKDFIVSFIGWFTLMGRRGIRVGDWVEINGVRGEVVEVNLLRTTLLETGNWTQPGHPTGRQVTFLNSFAVEGYYFNFTTAGRWLWDEITLHIPGGVNPYPIIEQIERTVATETAGSAQRAEEEWQRATRGYSVKSFSAAPAINVRSTVEGVEVTVRYITRAHERYDLRAHLSNAAVKLIHDARAGATPAPALPRSAKPGQGLSPS